MVGKCFSFYLSENLTRMKLTNDYSAVFQAGGLVVVLVEVNRKSYLASIVPVIVNAILSEHQIVADIVAFVNKGDFPRSRLGEKQRGKILAGWVTRKMRTVAQFAIRDLDASVLEPGEGPEANRASTGSLRSLGAAIPSGMRNVGQAPQILEQEEFTQQMDHMAHMEPVGYAMTSSDDQPTPTGYYPSGDHGQETASIDNYSQARLSTSNNQGGYQYEQYEPAQQHYEQPQEHYEQPQHFESVPHRKPVEPSHMDYREQDEQSLAEPEESSPAPDTPPARRLRLSQGPPQIRLPGVDGREGLDFWGDDEEETDWTTDAMMHMNLTGNLNNNAR
jgi:hypothetical protein